MRRDRVEIRTLMNEAFLGASQHVNTEEGDVNRVCAT